MDGKNRLSTWRTSRSQPHARMACNAFVTADDENHALALIVPATLSLAGDVAMRAFYKTLGWEYASNTTDSGTVLLGYFADGESRIRNRKAITAITGTTLPAVGLGQDDGGGRVAVCNWRESSCAGIPRFVTSFGPS